jgi:hypothetical protein
MRTRIFFFAAATSLVLLILLAGGALGQGTYQAQIRGSGFGPDWRCCRQCDRDHHRERH